MTALDELYQRTILEHHRAPLRAGRLDAPTHAADGNNPLCGDRVTVTLKIGEGRVLDVRCDVRGCAICRASGSLMAEAVAGRAVDEVRGLGERLRRAIAEPAPDAASARPGERSGEADAEWGALAALLEARRFPGRRRCATLTWETLERALGAPRPAGE
jgi:nitrogen fixation protein NifU and related proteins